MRRLLMTLYFLAAGASLFGQGKCRDGYGTPSCPLSETEATAPIEPVFAATGWKTVALDHLTFEVTDFKKESAFYIALMGWKLRSDDGKEAVLDIGDWGSAIFRQRSAEHFARLTNYCFVIQPWNAKTVEAELRKRGMNPVADNDGKGFESFHVLDPDGWDLQISNAEGLTKSRKRSVSEASLEPAPFASPGWKTVWLDHLSYNATDYKKVASFYVNLLGWKETYDEGSQQELMIGNIGDIIIRGGNPRNPQNGSFPTPRRGRIDHISFGITPWDTDSVKSELQKRGLEAKIDTSTRDDIHVAAFKSYHTNTPNGYNLQISYVTSANRLALPNAVKPKNAGGN